MKILKKIVFLSVFALLCGKTVSAEVQEFGNPAKHLTFDGPGMQTFYDSSHYFTDEFARSPKKSVKIVCVNDLNSDINVSFNPLNAISHQYNYYAELYVNSELPGEPIPRMFWISDENGIYSNQIFFSDSGIVDENGWRKYEAYIPTGQDSLYGTSTTIRIRGYYNSAETFNFYFDDLSIRYAPTKLEASDVTVKSDEIINLNDIRVFGYDNLGNKQLVRTNDVANWSVVSGDAQIDKNGYLILDDYSAQIVKIRLDFCGVSTTFNINVENSIDIPEFFEESLSVNNLSDSNKDLLAVFVLYDKDGRLFDTKCNNISVAAHTTELIDVPKFNIPYDMNSYQIKAFVFTDKQILTSIKQEGEN